MKNLNFKNFNYAMIDSARSGYREVLVTYTVEGKTVRKCLFIKEVKGKDKKYYLEQAKKEINASIKDGSLAKSASRQLSRGTKPALIAISAVLAAGALGTGGYFLGTYLGGGGGNNPGPVETTYTVALHAGTNGYFNQPGTLLVIFENVAKGTELNAISDYTRPKSDYEMEFDYWQVGTSDVKFAENEVVTSDLVLTAYFKDNLTSTRNKAKKEIYSVYENVKNSVDPVAEKDLIGLLKTMMDELNKSDSILNMTENQDLVKNIKDFTIKSIYTITYADPSVRNQLYNVYQGKISELEQTSKELSPSKANAIAKISDAYIAALADEKATPEALDKIYGDIESVVKNSETTDEVANLITYFAEGAVKVGSYIPTESTDLYNLFIEGITGYANAILAKKEENPTDEFLIETLGNLTNDYYKALANCVIEDDYDKISEAYKVALNSYPGTTFVEKEAYKLHEECLKSLSNLSGNVGIASKAFAQIIETFKSYCQQSAVDTDAKVAIIENICKSIIKGVGNLPDLTAVEVVKMTSECIINSNFDQNMVNFMNMVADAAANMPAIKSPEIQEAGAGFSVLINVAQKYERTLQPIIASEPKTEDEKKQRQDLINCLMNLSRGLIQSTCYSNLASVLGSVPAINAFHDEVMKAIAVGEVVDATNTSALIAAGAIRELSRAYGKFHNEFKNYLKNVDGCIGNLMRSLTDVRKEKGWEAEESFFAQAFDSCLSKSLYNYRAYILTSEIGNYEKNVNVVCNLPGTFVGKDPKSWENSVKFYSLYMDSEAFFYAVDRKSSEVVKERINYLFNSGTITIGCESLVYDQILTIWSEQFFSKITPTTSFDSFIELYNKTIEAIKALLG